MTKINSDGTYGWTKRMGDTWGESGIGIATDSSANVYVVGEFGSHGETVDFGADFGTTDSKTPAGGWDIFVTKLEPEPSNNPPVAVCTDIEISADDSCQAIIVPEDIDDGSYDPDGDEITLSIDPPGPFPLGENSVTLTVTDEYGESDSCTALVTVADTTPPVPDIAELLALSGECFVEITSTPTASDNCARIIVGTTSDPLVYGEQGTYLVTWTYDDGNGNTTTQTQEVTVQDVSAPTIESIEAAPNILWPPNHKMVEVTLSVKATDNCDVAPVSEIISVSSNEPENGTDDGDTAPDWEILGPLTVNLRAERSGIGSGRIYTITVQCTDEFGNSSIATTTVTVPLSK